MSGESPVHICFDLRTLGLLPPPARAYLCALVDGLLPALLAGNRATVLLREGESLPTQPIEHPALVYRWLRHPARTMRGAAEAAAVLRRLRPDVYWSADPWLSPPPTRGRRWQMRVVYALEGLPRRSRGLAGLRASLRRHMLAYPRLSAADSLVCPTHALSVRLIARLGLRTRRRVRVIPNGVGPVFRRHTEEEILVARRAWLVPRRYVIMAGRSDFVDELAVPLRALGGNEETSSATCVVVGDARLPDALRQTVRACHLEGMVRFIDAAAITSEALSALYDGAVATFEPARGSDYRPSILRSLACGTPVICAATPANRELGGNATLRVHPTDPAEWARAFVSLTLSAPLRERLAAAGAAWVAERTWGAAARGTFALAQELARRP